MEYDDTDAIYIREGYSFTTTRVAERMGVRHVTVLVWIAEGDLPSI